MGQTYQTTKTRQTLQDLNIPETLNEQAATWWIEQTDETVWQQLPPSELPKAHYTNVHHGCPNCGTAIYRYGGFYPWSRNHLPCDFKSTCPNCNAVFPSNSLTSQDYTSGQFPDDGYGYFDKDEHIFIFAASYHRDQCRTFGSGIDTLTAYLRKNGPNEQVARRLGLMLLRYAQEECYVASAPQFRFGAQIGGTEEPWNWGQPDWASQPDPVRALKRKGTQRYAIDTPNISRTLALAYDTIWPHLLKDTQLVSSAQSLGLHIQRRRATHRRNARHPAPEHPGRRRG